MATSRSWFVELVADDVERSKIRISEKVKIVAIFWMVVVVMAAVGSCSGRLMISLYL